MKTSEKSQAELLRENAELRSRLAEAEEALRAIRAGEGNTRVASRQVDGLPGAEIPGQSCDGVEQHVAERTGELQEANQALRRSEALYRAIGESIDYGVWVCAPDGRNTYASESFLKLVGLTQKQCSDFGWGEVLHPDDAERTISAWKECVRTGGTWDIEHRFRGVDGQWHSVLARGVPVKDEQGQILCWAGINLDISRQKRAEEALQAAHQQMATILRSITDAFFALDRDWRFTYVNPETERLVRKPAAELLGRNIWLLFPDAEAFHARYDEALSVGQAVHFEEFYTPLETWFEVHAYPSADGLSIYFRDATERRRVQEALRESEERYRMVAEFTFDWEFWINLDGSFRYVSPSAERVLGQPVGPTETAEELLRRVVHPEDLDKRLRHLDEELADCGPCELEFHIVRPDGDVRCIHHVCRPIHDANGHFLGIRGSNRDITERKRAEEALAAAHAEVVSEKNRLEAVMQALPVGLAVLDVRGGNIQVNPAFDEIWGGPRPPANEISDYAAYHARWVSTGQPVQAEEWASARAVQRGETVVGQELEIQRFNGTRAFVLNSAVPIRDAEGRVTGCAVAILDITKLKEAEEAASRNQKTFFELVERAPFGIYVIDSQFRIAQMNVGSQNRAFRNVRPVIGRDFAEAMRILWPEPVAAGIIAAFRHTLDTGEPYYSPRFVNPRHDVAAVESYEWELHRMMLPDGQYGVICYYFDSTSLREAEEKLREVSQRLSYHVDHSPLAVIEWGPDMRLTRWSGEAEHMFGWKAEEVLGRQMDDFRWIYPEDRPKVDKVTTGLRDGTAPRRLSANRNYRKDGSVVWCEWYNSSLLDESGKLRSILSLVLDVSARHQAERERRKFVLLADHSAEFIGICDPQLNPLYVNAAGLRMVGLDSPEQAFRTPVKEFFFPEDQRFIGEAFLPRVMREGSGEVEIRFRHFQTGEAVWMIYSVFFLKDTEGQPVGLATVSRNITARRRAEEEVRALNAQLEQRVAERTDDLRQANQILHMVSECNQALVRIADEQELVRKICSIINDAGGYRMAWVGVAEPDKGKWVRPIASVGFDEGYLDKVRITWADNKFGRGPTGTAIRTGIVCVGDDFLTQPALAPWRKLALQHGFRSSVALPLIVGGQRWGVLTIYASYPQAFSRSQVNLLSDLAGDLSYGITALRTQADRARAREDLEKKTTQLRVLAGELVQAEQRERRRIAQVLHDHLQQLLVGARYKVAYLQNESRPRGFQREMGRVDNLLSHCMEISRSLTAELSPPILHEAGLGVALKWLARWFHEVHGLTVRVSGNDVKLADAEDIRVALFQGVRELLFNVVKHAKVNQAQVRISRLPSGQLKIVVSDRGVGFDPAKIGVRRGSKPSIGLLSLRERLEMLGGAMSVQTVPGGGSRFTMSVPLSDAPAGGKTTPPARSRKTSRRPRKPCIRTPKQRNHEIRETHEGNGS